MMDDNDITELAKGMVPFVRECVAEATAVPPELAEQIASAVRMLHESPAIQREAPLPPKVTRIERDADGNFVPVYDQPV
jgi:uncharacterized protein Yka (UPF0111/DUF47 family)